MKALGTGTHANGSAWDAYARVALQVGTVNEDKASSQRRKPLPGTDRPVLVAH